MFADPSKLTPPIVLAVVSLLADVAVDALPVRVPVTSPVTLPDRLPLNVPVASVLVAGLNVSEPSV